MEALGYLFSAYSHKRRRLGPMAVLHPLRTTAIFTRFFDDLALVKLLTLLFHDILEDVKPVQFDTQQWKSMEDQMDTLLQRLDPADESKLTQNLLCLTRLERESYYHYIGRLLENARNAPELVAVKLADRLDNTLDMRIDLEDALAKIDFFETIFQILFVASYPGHKPWTEHAPSSAINGARRLYQLFKNAVLLSLIRQHTPPEGQRVVQTLFNETAEASLKEAQRTLIHLISYHIRELGVQRDLLLQAMQYCYSGRSEMVTKPDGSQLLDGLFSTYFRHTSPRVRNTQLDILYQNKPLMLEASVAFIVIFLSFLNDPKFYVKGISTRGIRAM
jgi:hypothetical protein